jgi:hypothetical protein
MSVGVLNQNGVSFTSLPFFSDFQSGKLFGQNPFKQELKDIVVQLKAIKDYDAPKKRGKKNNFHKRIAFNELNRLLALSEKQSSTCYLYKNVYSAMRGQKLFIEIGLHMIKFIDWADDDMKPYYNDALDLVF